MPGYRLRIPINSGSWSNSAIWDSGALPVPGDFVSANGFTILIDQDINVAQLNTVASTNNGVTEYMTSNTSPAGFAVSASTSGFPAWHAFDNSESTYWSSTVAPSTTPQWIVYQHNSPIVINKYAWRAGTNSQQRPNNWLFQASNDGVNWTTLETKTASAPAVSTYYTSSLLGNTTAYQYYRIYVSATVTSTWETWIANIRLYEPDNTGSSTVAGGGFRVTGSQSITCTNSTGVLAGSTTVINFSGSSDSNMTLNATIVGTSTTNDITAIRKIAPGTLNINGNINITNSFGGNRHGLEVSSTGTVNVVGNVQGRYQNRGIRMLAGSATSTLNVTGIVNPAKTLETSDVQIEILSVCNVNITGDIYGGSSSGHGVLISAAATVNITGAVYGGANTAAIFSTVNQYLNIVGPLVAFSTLPNEVAAVSSTGTGAINIFSGPFISGPYGTAPFQVLRMHYRPTSGSYYEFRDNSTNGALSPGATGSRTYLYAPSTVISAPNQNNVRFGTVYASGSQTGQMRVPLPSQVSAGIPVDNTVGTAVLSTNDVVNAIWNSSITELTASNSIGNRLRNVSTPDITANQIIGLI